MGGLKFVKGKYKELRIFGCVQSNNAHENASSSLKYHHYISVSSFSIGLELKHSKGNCFLF